MGMKLKMFFGIFLNIGLSLNCLSQNIKDVEEICEVYIMPKQPDYGWLSNPWVIFHFDEKKSELVPYEVRSYYTTTQKDSVYELYYKQIKFPLFLFSNLEKIKDTINPLKTSLARIVIFDQNRDTIIVDSKKIIYKNDMCYKMTDQIWNILFALMPPELAENWLINYDTDGQDDTYNRKSKKN